jgi:hypothetical protein
VTALGGEQGESFFSSRPDGAYMGGEPTAEFKAVELGLIKQQTQQLFFIHFTNPWGTRRTWGSGGSSKETPQLRADRVKHYQERPVSH